MAKPSERQGKAFQVYDSVISHETDSLLEIQKAKLSEGKSDIEIAAEIEQTMLYYLERFNMSQKFIEEEEYRELREKHTELRDALEIIRAHTRYLVHFNE